MRYIRFNLETDDTRVVLGYKNLKAQHLGALVSVLNDGSFCVNEHYIVQNVMFRQRF